jgi:DNA-binding MarR family transcriptional regulator
MKRTNGRSASVGTEAATQSILLHWREAVPDDRLAHLVKDSTRALLRALQMGLAKHGVSIGHWTFLRILWARDGLTQRELSEQAGLMEPTTFSAVQAMQRLGYVTRRHKPDNRKKVYIYLTPKGRLLERKLVPIAKAVNKIGARGVPAGDIATTRRTLLAVIENLARDEAALKQVKPKKASVRSHGRPLPPPERGRVGVGVDGTK